MASEIRILSGKCGHHFTADCPSCADANKYNDDQLLRLYEEIREERAAVAELVEIGRRILDRGYISEHIEEECGDHLALKDALSRHQAGLGKGVERG